MQQLLFQNYFCYIQRKSMQQIYEGITMLSTIFFYACTIIAWLLLYILDVPNAPLYACIVLIAPSAYVIYHLFNVALVSDTLYKDLSLQESTLPLILYLLWQDISFKLPYPYSPLIVVSLGIFFSALCLIYLYKGREKNHFKIGYMLLLFIGLTYTFVGGYRLMTGHKFFPHWRI